MNNNQISNPKLEVPKGLKLNDKDYLNSVLSKEKEMTKNYVLAMTEASNDILYEKYKFMYDKVASLQRKIYQAMFRCGWYCLEKVEEQKITQKLDKLNQELSDLNQNN